LKKFDQKKNRLALPALSYSFFSFLSKITGFVRDIFLASFLGSSFIADVFFIALRLPNSFRRSFSEETFNPAYIPVYGKYSDKGGGLELEFTKQILLAFLVPSILVSFLVVIYMPEVLDTFLFLSDDEAQNQILIDVCRIIFPYLLVIVISAVFLGNMNANKKFSLSAGIPSVLNLVLVFSVASYTLVDVEKIYYLAWSVILAGILQIIIVFSSISSKFWRILASYSEVNKRGLADFFKLYWPTFISSSLFQINLVVGMLVCSFETGAVSYLYYSERLFYLPLTLIGVAIGVVLVPNLSEYLRRKEHQLAIEQTNKASHYLLSTIIPLTALLLVLSVEIVSFLFERGEFNAESTKNTASIFTLFLLGLPAAGFIKILTPYFFALEKPKLPLIASLKSNVLNFLLILVLFQLIGFRGVPLALSISSWVLVYLLLKEHKKNNFFKIEAEVKLNVFKYIFLFFLILSSGFWLSNFSQIDNLTSVNKILIISSIEVCIYLGFVYLFDRDLSKQLNSFYRKFIS
tara:strand:+ start:4123 stop:5679 length:1557 start_codon:yes stop_codon:yes gene_type:complete